MDELEDGREARVHAVEGEEEDGEDLRDRDVEEEVLGVVGWVALAGFSISFFVDAECGVQRSGGGGGGE